MASIHSFLLALGEFAVEKAFAPEDMEEGQVNNEYMFVFWVIFLVGTVCALLIILNMVIAVMSSTFARVGEENAAHIYRERLLAILDKIGHFPADIKRQFSAHKYLLLVEVDPESDAIEQETEETRITSEITSLKAYIAWMKKSQSRLKNSLTALHERVTGFEKKLDKKIS